MDNLYHSIRASIDRVSIFNIQKDQEVEILKSKADKWNLLQQRFSGLPVEIDIHQKIENMTNFLTQLSSGTLDLSTNINYTRLFLYCNIFFTSNFHLNKLGSKVKNIMHRPKKLLW